MRPDLQNLRLIVKYCDYIEANIERFGDDIEDFIDDVSYQASTAKFLELIGEYVKRLSDDVKVEYDAVEWNKVSGMRNFLAHQYERMDLEVVWVTINDRIPFLKRYCLDIIRVLESDSADDQ